MHFTCPNRLRSLQTSIFPSLLLVVALPSQFFVVKFCIFKLTCPQKVYTPKSKRQKRRKIKICLHWTKKWTSTRRLNIRLGTIGQT